MSQQQQNQSISENPISFVCPTSGNLFYEKKPNLLFCNPHLMSIKSITLEKLEKMHAEAHKQMQANREKN